MSKIIQAGDLILIGSTLYKEPIFIPYSSEQLEKLNDNEDNYGYNLR